MKETASKNALPKFKLLCYLPVFLYFFLVKRTRKVVLYACIVPCILYESEDLILAKPYTELKENTELIFVLVASRQTLVLYRDVCFKVGTFLHRATKQGALMYSGIARGIAKKKKRTCHKNRVRETDGRAIYDGRR